MTPDTLTQQGIAALKAGNKAQARKLLVEAVQQNPQNQVALLWLAGTIDNLDNQRRCLERAVSIDPTSQTGKLAARGLEQLALKAQSHLPQQPATPPAPPPAPPTPDAQEPQPTEEVTATLPAHASVLPQPEATATEPVPLSSAPAIQPPASIHPLSTAQSQPAEVSATVTPALSEAAPPEVVSLPPLSPPPLSPSPQSPPPSGAYKPVAPVEEKRKIPAWAWVVGVLTLTVLMPCLCIGTVGVLTLLGQSTSDQADGEFDDEDGGLFDFGEAPSIPITTLVPFTHEETGITGMRPENWELFSSEDFFEASSSLEAPDDFMAWVMPPDEFPEGSILDASEDFLSWFKYNEADGPPPEIMEEHVSNDGHATLLVSYTGLDWMQEETVRYTAYVRTRPVSQGLLVIYAYVPSDQFPDQEATIREMVDSLDVLHGQDASW